MDKMRFIEGHRIWTDQYDIPIGLTYKSTSIVLRNHESQVSLASA